MENSEETDPGISIKSAFYQALQERGVYKKIGLSKPSVSNYLKNIEKGEFPSHEKMSEILQKLGYAIIQKERWQKL